MLKKFIYPQVIFIMGLMLLSACTSYMKGTMDMERGNYEAAIESFRQELSKNPTLNRPLYLILAIRLW